MDNSFQDAFDQGFTKVVMIGSDSPTFPEAALIKAYDDLNKANAVIGPAPDGGFWLVGLNKHHTQIFSPLQLSTNQACTDLIERLQQLKLSNIFAENCFDVDSEKELRMLSKQLHELSSPSLNHLKTVVNKLMQSIQAK